MVTAISVVAITVQHVVGCFSAPPPSAAQAAAMASSRQSGRAAPPTDWSSCRADHKKVARGCPTRRRALRVLILASVTDSAPRAPRTVLYRYRIMLSYTRIVHPNPFTLAVLFYTIFYHEEMRRSTYTTRIYTTIRIMIHTDTYVSIKYTTY